MKFLSLDGLTHLKLLLKNAFATKTHTHTKSEITDYTDYTLPTASADTLGGVKVGAGLTMNEGVLSATGGGVADSVDWSNVQNKPTIPTNNNQLTNGAGYQTASDVESAINSKISSVMKYKGTVDDYTNLPSNANVGDTYNVTNSSDNNNAGDNLCWNGTSWDNLGGTIDLSDYVKDTDLVEISNEEIDTLWNS